MDNKMMEKLKKFNKNFAAQKSRADELGGFSEVPDGKYLCKVSDAQVKESNAGALHFVFQFEILESAEDESLVGVKVSKWAGIEGEDQIAYLIRDLRKFGIEMESIEDLGKIGDLLTKQQPELKVTLKSKDSGQFSYIDKVIGEVEAGDMGADEDSNDSDDDSAEDDSEEEESEEEKEATETDDVALEVGMEVSFTWKGEDMTGKIKEILEDEEKLKISSGGKIYPVKLADVTLPEAEETEEAEEEEEEEEEKPVKKAAPKKVEPAKKAAPAPKAKAKPVTKKK